MAIMLSMGALKCTAHLLPLLRPLRFIVNAYNKCVTLALIIINENDNPMLFFDSSVGINKVHEMGPITNSVDIII